MLYGHNKIPTLCRGSPEYLAGLETDTEAYIMQSA
jgi:hypothetical protein